MNEAVKPSDGMDRPPAERPADRFVTRWASGDRSCIPPNPGALVMVPYPGLRSFKPELNQFFFGRERQKAELKAFFAGRAREAGQARRQITFVVGGSGSGKSSLTLAGLIAELNTIDMATTPGAWYVAQMRPAQDPIAQLLASLSGVVARVVDVATADPDPARATEQFSKVAAALKCSGASDLPSLKQLLHDQLSERLAPVDKATGRRSLAIAALFQFVDQTLDKLDELESHAQRSGKPLLMIHIDQFEEVFREQTDADGRQALMQLLRKVHEYAPERLFVVATMRSEELHKCSEFEGIADVINSSMYLIDLVSNEEIERAIVEPARRQTILWELPTSLSETAPYTAEAIRWLQRAYQAAGVAALHTADQLPLLQHFLPLLWEEAVDDWLRCREKDPAARFEITKDHIEKVPGWIAPAKPGSNVGMTGGENQNQTSHLARCLNAHADAILERATEKWCGLEISPVPVSGTQAAKTSIDKSSIAKPSIDKSAAVRKAADGPRSGFDDPSPERAILIVAFCCLAQLDDRGRPARRFATSEEIVAASGLPEWKVQKYDRAVLCQAVEIELHEFERAGLIERIGSEQPLRYNVNHEAFIRNWDSYEGWLKEKQFVQQRLREIDSFVGRPREKDSWNLLDRTFTNQARDAYAIIPDETGARLQSVFGEQPVFSRAWAAAALSDQPSTERVRTPANNFGAIEAVWEKARWWQKNRWRPLVYRLGVAMLAVGLVAFWLLASWNQTLNSQLYNSIISLRASLFDVGGAVQYRELYASLLTAYEDHATQALEGQSRRILRATLYQIDSGVRQTLGGDVSLLAADNSPANSAKASCRMTSGGADKLLGRAPDGTEIGFSQADRYWSPVDTNTSYRGIEQVMQTSNGLSLPDNTLLCLSHDARWLLFWTDGGYPPVLVRVVWSKLNGEWKAGQLPQRQIKSTVDLTKLTSLEARRSYDYVTNQLTTTEALERVESFNKDGWAGFSLPSADGAKLLVWSTTGLSDPDDSTDVTPAKLQKCGDYRDVAARAGGGSRAVKECRFRVGVPELGEQDLVINYADEDCGDATSECQSTIELRYLDKSVRSLKNDEVAVRIMHRFARISEAGMQDSWLWLKDDNGKTWRYLIARDKMMPLIELKWQGVTWNHGDQTAFENFRPSDFCREFKPCSDYLFNKTDGNWPKPPPELRDKSR